jgi:hypothetical protein
VEVHYYNMIKLGRTHSIIIYLYINMKGFESYVYTRVDNLTNQLPQFCIYDCLLLLAHPSLGFCNYHSFVTLSF